MPGPRSEAQQRVHDALIEQVETHGLSIRVAAEALGVRYSTAKGWMHRRRKEREKAIARKVAEEVEKRSEAAVKRARKPGVVRRGAPPVLEPDVMTGDVRKHWRDAIKRRLAYLATAESVTDPNQAKVATTMAILIEKCPGILDRFADESEVAKDTAAQMERVRNAFKLPSSAAVVH